MLNQQYLCWLNSVINHDGNGTQYPATPEQALQKTRKSWRKQAPDP
jgi:hypothetical protein